MRKAWKIILIVVLLLLTIPFAFDILTVRTLEWQTIQRYGGVKVGQPIDTENGYYLPIIFNTSGTASITIQPIAMSSFYVCKRTTIKRKDKNIFISIKRSGAFFSGETCNCKATKLGHLDYGHYKVYYDTGEFIGEFDI